MMEARSPNKDSAVLEAFGRFAAAVREGDVDGFRALAVHDAPPQEQLFLRNSGKVRRAGLSLRARLIQYLGEVACVRFDLLDGKGVRLDAAEVFFTLEADGWRLRSL